VGEVIKVHEVLAHEVDAPEPGIGIGSRERHEAISEVVGGNDVGQAGGEERRRSQGAVPVSEY
jgi:hypothetical protein